MPALVSRPLHIRRYNSAKSFLLATYNTLRRHEGSANIILAHAMKRLSSEEILTACQFVTDTDTPAPLPSFDEPSDNGNFWLTITSSHSIAAPHSLELVLSCTSGTFGNYPIFIWTPVEPSTLSSSWLVPRVSILAEELLKCVEPERVFSVFGPSPLIKSFSKVWTEYTGFSVEKEPYYAAYLTFCTPSTFIRSEPSVPEGYALRRASIQDLNGVGKLCLEFSEDSAFPLTAEEARVEARDLISKGIIWVYEVYGGEIAAICAVTRNSLKVSAITKVYTTMKWRRMGFAEQLVRAVTSLLFECGKERVVLYVGHQNCAQSVYDRVGFVGLCGKDKPMGVEDVLELGFIGTEKGHW